MTNTSIMGEPIPLKKKFNTELTDYSVQHSSRTGPYAENLEVDALIVGAGFGALPSAKQKHTTSTANVT